MAVQIRFDSLHNPIPPTIVLTTRNGRKLGKIPAKNVTFKGSMSNGFDMSFRVYKVDCPHLWDRITDFKCVWAKEWNQLFEIEVETDDDGSLTKNVTAVSLGKAELSQIKLYEKEINTENDIARDDYEPTVFCDENNPSASLLHRLIEKAPHYCIGHVDTSLKNIQRTFTFNDKTVQDAFKEVSEEIGCLIQIDCGYDKNNKLVRSINAYDMKSVCLECGTRGSFEDKCSKCGSTNISHGYGNDTTIFASTENLADNIKFSTDNGSVKNCFRLEAGDDLMTAAVVSCNPNGSEYIWNISEDMKSDMSEDLVRLINEYNEMYAYYQKEHSVDIDDALRTSYNNLVDKYSAFTSDYKKIGSSIVGYSSLMERYFDAIDFGVYLTSKLMPSPEMADTNAQKQLERIREALLSPVSVKNIDNVSATTAESAVSGMVKAVVDGRYKITISESAFADNTWSGIVSLTSYADEEDTATSDRLTCHIDGNYEGYVKQKILKAIKQSVDDSVSIENMFALSDIDFANEMKKYCLSRLTTFHDLCQTCVDILIEHGLSDSSKYAYKDEDLYNKVYLPYYNKLHIIEQEIIVREEEIATVSGSYDNDGKLITRGMRNFIEEQVADIHSKLNFEEYLGEEHMLELAAYRREDTYKNPNYVSDGLNNAELFRMALSFIEAAESEIIKSSTQQHTISAKLRNLLAMKEFALIVDKFELGNWIRIRTDGKLYKLRLIEYQIDFDNFDNIDVDFSDLVYSKDSVSDVESVLSKASSMASSYEYVARQANKGEASNSQLADWVERGLDLTKLRIVDNADNQNVTWDNHGLLCKEYLPINGKYDDKQLKIINRGLYLTDDGWKTSKAGIGDFTYWNPKTGKMEESYGVIADVIVGNIILSEEVGIYNQNNSVTMDQNGLVITATPNETDETKNLLMVRRQVEQDGVMKYEKLLYLDDNGYLVLNGSVRFQTPGSTDSFEDVNKKISDVEEDISKVVDRIDGFNGLFFYIRYSEFEDGKNMTESPDANTKYMGTCNTDEKEAPTDPSRYTWSKIKGDQGTQGFKGEDGTSQYLHIRYSNDGNSFTADGGTTLGDWIGTCVTQTNVAPTEFSAYQWSKFNGTDGINTSILYLYKRDSIKPGLFANNLTYTFGTGKLNGDLNGWTQTIPPSNGCPCYMIQAMAASSKNEDTIPASEWSEPVKFVEDGANGNNTAIVYLYRRSASPLSVTWEDTLTYSFATKLLSSVPSGWSQSVPSGTDPLYVTMATAYGNTATDTIDANQWCDPVILAENGKDGKSSYFYVRYSEYSDGSSMSATPTDSTMYIGVCTTSSASAPTTPASYKWSRFRGNDGIPGAAGADGRTQYLHIKYSNDGETFTGNDGEDLGTYIGTLVDFNQTDSTNFSDYKWKQFTGDLTVDMAEIQRRIDDSADAIYDTIDQKEQGVRDKIDEETGGIRDAMSNELNTIRNTIKNNYDAAMAEATKVLNDYRAEVGQYMEFGNSGLILGASSSSFKTVIDNQGMYFKEGDAIVSYVKNNQLHIPNAVIESTMALGNFFFSPRSDGSVSLVWQDGTAS